MRDERPSEAETGDELENASAGARPADPGGQPVRGGSIDDMARTLATFGTRLDALVTSTTSYRSAITERLVDYSDTVTRLVKNQTSDLAEQRSANKNLLSELQSGIAASEAAVRSLTDRIDTMTESSTGPASQELLVEIRSVLDAQERLGQFLTDALDQFGDRVVERLEVTEAAVGGDAIASAISAAQESDERVVTALADIRSHVEGLRDSLVDLASGDVVGALWDEVRSLRSVVDDLRKGPASAAPPQGAALAEGRVIDAVGSIRAELRRLRDDLTGGLVVEADDSLVDHLQEIRTAVDSVNDRVDALGSSVSAAVEDDDGLGDRLAALRDELVTELEAVRRVLTQRRSDPAETTEAVAAAINTELAALRRRIKVRSDASVLTDEQLDRIAEAVAARLA